MGTDQPGKTGWTEPLACQLPGLYLNRAPEGRVFPLQGEEIAEGAGSGRGTGGQQVRSEKPNEERRRHTPAPLRARRVGTATEGGTRRANS